jgi:hypothetical protein
MESYKIIFKGEVIKEENRLKIESALANYFKLPQDKAHILFNGKSYSLKKGLSMNAATDISNKFKLIGVKTYLIEEKEVLDNISTRQSVDEPETNTESISTQTSVDEPKTNTESISTQQSVDEPETNTESISTQQSVDEPETNTETKQKKSNFSEFLSKVIELDSVILKLILKRNTPSQLKQNYRFLIYPLILSFTLNCIFIFQKKEINIEQDKFVLTKEAPESVDITSSTTLTSKPIIHNSNTKKDSIDFITYSTELVPNFKLMKSTLDELLINQQWSIEGRATEANPLKVYKLSGTIPHYAFKNFIMNNPSDIGTSINKQYELLEIENKSVLDLWSELGCQVKSENNIPFTETVLSCDSLSKARSSLIYKSVMDNNKLTEYLKEETSFDLIFSVNERKKTLELDSFNCGKSCYFDRKEALKYLLNFKEVDFD